MEADLCIHPLQLPCLSCFSLPCVPTMQHSSLVGGRFSPLPPGSSSSSGKPMARVLAAGAALFMEGAQQHPELVSGQFCLDWDGAAQRNPVQVYNGWRSCLWLQ